MYFLNKYKNAMIVTLVTIILIITIGITNSREKPSGVEDFIGTIFAPVNKVFYTIGSKLSGSFKSVSDLFDLKKEKERLETEVLKLEEKNRDLENIIGKSDFLKDEAQLLKKTKRDLLSAQIISKELGNWYNRFTIDKGSKDGIKVGTIIIKGIDNKDGQIEEGLVGRVIEVKSNSAIVISIIDDQNRISFKSIKTQDGGILQGNINNGMEGFLFDRKAKVMKGDSLYTSGLGKVYKKDLYIGEVIDVVHVEEELMKKIIVKPAVDFQKLYKVFAILD